MMIWMLLWLIQPSAITDQFNNPYEIHTLNGHWVVVDFAASWCGPCHKALPQLQRLADSNTAVKVIVVCVDNTKKGYSGLIERHKLSMPVLWDQQQSWVAHFNPPGMPTTLVLDPNGKVVYQHTGYSPEDWSKLLQFLNHTVSVGSSSTASE
ncbi:MAG: TlpA family protein disulfide reductase [Acidobacteria bacterium]|nr:TlpA family protein disulfide reductase [Acidobacteriota bacterium]